MSVTVKLSYEEKILNALGRVKHKRTDDCITRGKREFDAIREVLKPLYEELEEGRKLRSGIEDLINSIDGNQQIWGDKFIGHLQVLLDPEEG